MARPSEYSEAAAELFCELVGDGQKLADICRRDDMPAGSTIYRWLAEHPDFAKNYGYAREAYLHRLRDECVEIADNVAADHPPAAPDGGHRPASYVAVQRDRLRWEVRRWLIKNLTLRRYRAGYDPEYPGAGEEPVSSRRPDIEWPEAE